MNNYHSLIIVKQLNILTFMVWPIRQRSRMNKFTRNIKIYFEPMVWAASLIALFFMVPSSSHFTLCPLANLGFDFCPGCGLGHSIHYAMWFDFAQSFSSHPLGIVAILIILHRIYKLILKPLKYSQS